MRTGLPSGLSRESADCEADQTLSDTNGRKGTWLFVVPWALDDRRGVDQVVINLSHVLRKRGYTPSFLIDDWAYTEMAATPGSNGQEVRYRLRAPMYGNHPLLSFARFLWDLPSLLRTLSRFLRSNRVAVINSHYPGVGNILFSLVRSLRLARFRLVLSVHGADIRSASESSWIEKMQWKLLLRSVDAVVACSNDFSIEVKQAFPGSNHHVIAVHNGIDIPGFLDGRDTTFCLPQSLSRAPYLLTVASYEWKKGLDVLVEATARIVHRYPDLHVVFVGSDGPDRSRIEALVEGRGLSDRVHMYVDLPHSQVLTFMESARVFVLPSRIEPFGLVLLEAGVCARPVVATRVGGIPEIVQDGVSGRLVQPENPDELASALCALMDAPDEALRYGAALRHRVANEFSWDRAGNQYLRIIGNEAPVWGTSSE
jgi:glycosyltransferase involved in cell wall biosynthesis